MPPEYKQQGFTLIEIAVALFILGIVLSAILVPLAQRTQEDQVGVATKQLAEIKELLLGFASANGYLPCPDKTSGGGANDGAEDLTGGTTCAVTTGNLPNQTIGFRTDSDPWGNRYMYRVEANYAQRSPRLISLTTAANIRVCETSACANILTDSGTPGNEATAAFWTFGRNGYGAINALTSSVNPAPTSADELANTNTAAGSLVSRIRTDAGTTSGEFDDVLIWIGRSDVFGAMVRTGQLPQ